MISHDGERGALPYSRHRSSTIFPTSRQTSGYTEIQKAATPRQEFRRSHSVPYSDFPQPEPHIGFVQPFLEPHMAPISPPRESRNTAMPQCGGGGGARRSCSRRGRGIAGLGNPRYTISRLPARAQSFFLALPAEPPRGIGCRVLPDSGVLTATHCATTPLLLCSAPDRSSANGTRFGHPGPPQLLQCVACQHKGDGGARRGEMGSARRELLTSA